jgi:hypothetical protein
VSLQDGCNAFARIKVKGGLGADEKTMEVKEEGKDSSQATSLPPRQAIEICTIRIVAPMKRIGIRRIFLIEMWPRRG